MSCWWGPMPYMALWLPQCLHKAPWPLYTQIFHMWLWWLIISGTVFKDWSSVATVMTDDFQKNGFMESRKLVKIVRIFVDIGHIKNWGVIYWPERIGLVISMLWTDLWPLCSVGITCPILSGQYMTPWFFMCPMSTNILTILANLLDTINPFFWKTSVMTVATLDWSELNKVLIRVPGAFPTIARLVSRLTGPAV